MTPVIYFGKRLAGECLVYRQNLEKGPRYLLKQRRDLADYSQTGYGWGRPEQGPDQDQLALALLADALGEDEALEWDHDFCEEIVEKLPAEWVMTQERIMDWYARKAQDRQLNPAKTAD